MQVMESMIFRLSFQPADLQRQVSCHSVKGSLVNVVTTHCQVYQVLSLVSKVTS